MFQGWWFEVPRVVVLSSLSGRWCVSNLALVGVQSKAGGFGWFWKGWWVPSSGLVGGQPGAGEYPVQCLWARIIKEYQWVSTPGLPVLAFKKSVVVFNVAADGGGGLE